MGRSAASKGEMGLRPDYRKARHHAYGENVSGNKRKFVDAMNDSMNYEFHDEGEDVGNHWMQNVHPKKGALHKAMHIPAGKKISTGALEKETHSKSPLMRKRANLALRYRGD